MRKQIEPEGMPGVGHTLGGLDSQLLEEWGDCENGISWPTLPVLGVWGARCGFLMGVVVVK